MTGWAATGVAFVVVASALFVPILVDRVTRRRPTPRPALDCGDPDDGRPIYFCMYCNNSRCEQHRDGGHLCRCGSCFGFGEIMHEPCWAV